LFFVTLTGKERLTFNRILGFTFAFLGVLILRKIETFSLSDQTLVGDLLTIFNCLSCGLFFALSKSFFETYRTIWTTSWLFGFGSIGLSLLAIPQWQEFQPPHLSLPLVEAMIFSIFGSTLLAYLLNLWALARTQSSSVALYIYLQPVIASGLAWMSLGEAMTLRIGLSCILIFGGFVIASIWNKPSLSRPARSRSKSLIH
jgi:drug/metabolite transporter (DMT)-like permease